MPRLPDPVTRLRRPTPLTSEQFTLARTTEHADPVERILVFDPGNPRMRLMIVCLIATMLLAGALAAGGITAGALVGVLIAIVMLALQEVAHNATHARRASRRG